MTERYNIESTYTFYFCSGYVGGTAEEIMSMRDITGYETQEQLDNAPREHVEKCFKEEYNTFASNLDTGWYENEQ